MSEARGRAVGVWVVLVASLAIALVVFPGGAAAELADPTRPPFFGAPDDVPPGTQRAERLVLSSVLISPGRRVAVINGHRIGVGGKVDGATVVEIERRYVRLERAGAPVELFLKSPSIKTKRSQDK